MICILFAFLIPACSPTAVNLDCRTTPINVVNVGIDAKSNIKARILIDGTPSMEGFVKARGVDNRYVQILQSLTSAASQTSTPAYYRFGMTREGSNYMDDGSISPQVFEKAQLPEFYNGTNLVYLENSQVSLAIAPPNQKALKTDELVIVVTDLNEKDQAIDTVIDQLDNLYLKQGFAVGILAVRSQFQGEIFDIGPDNQKFEFSTQKDVSQYHPFYVLVLGSYGNVANFYEILRKQQEKLLSRETQFTIFYPALVKSTSTFNLEKYPLKFSDDHGGIEAPTINDGSISVLIEDSNKFPSFRVDDSNQYKFKHRVDYERVPYTLEAKLEMTVVSRILEKKEDKSAPDGFKADSGRLEIKNLQPDSGQLGFESVIDGGKLSTGIYEFNANAYIKGTEEQQWWQNWNDNTGLDGSKTYNLLRMMRGLGIRVNKMVETQKTLAGRFCYAIWKR